VTILVKQLVERNKLRRKYDASPLPPNRRWEGQIRDCERVIKYLMQRFDSHSHDCSRSNAESCSAPLDHPEYAEIHAMNDAELLRYGSALRYICIVEAGLQDMPLQECQAKFRLAQTEWRKRFGNSILRDSIRYL
jgi:hypothetical protein